MPTNASAPDYQPSLPLHVHRENPGPLGRFYNKAMRRDLMWRAKVAPNASGVKQTEDGHVTSVQQAKTFTGSGRCSPELSRLYGHAAFDTRHPLSSQPQAGHA